MRKIGISNFNTQNLQFMQRMFDNCPSLKGIRINKKSLSKFEKKIPSNITLIEYD